MELKGDDNTYLSRYIKSTNTRQYFPLCELEYFQVQQTNIFIFSFTDQNSSNIYQNILNHINYIFMNYCLCYDFS